MNETLLIETTRFGTVGYTEDDIVTFSEGLVGFPDHRSYVLLNHKPNSPFRWLQSLEESQLAFLVTDPNHWDSDYAPKISDEDARELGLDAEAPRLVYVTVAIPPGAPDKLTFNFAGPIVINAATRTAIQLVLQDETYTTKHRTFTEVNRADAVAA